MSSARIAERIIAGLKDNEQHLKGELARVKREYFESIEEVRSNKRVLPRLTKTIVLEVESLASRRCFKIILSGQQVIDQSRVDSVVESREEEISAGIFSGLFLFLFVSGIFYGSGFCGFAPDRCLNWFVFLITLLGVFPAVYLIAELAWLRSFIYARQYFVGGYLISILFLSLISISYLVENYALSFIFGFTYFLLIIMFLLDFSCKDCNYRCCLKEVYSFIGDEGVKALRSIYRAGLGGLNGGVGSVVSGCEKIVGEAWNHSVEFKCGGEELKGVVEHCSVLISVWRFLGNIEAKDIRGGLDDDGLFEFYKVVGREAGLLEDIFGDVFSHYRRMKLFEHGLLLNSFIRSGLEAELASDFLSASESYKRALRVLGDIEKLAGEGADLSILGYVSPFNFDYCKHVLMSLAKFQLMSMSVIGEDSGSLGKDLKQLKKIILDSVESSVVGNVFVDLAIYAAYIMRS